MPRLVDHDVRRAEIAAAACGAIAKHGIDGVKLTDVGAEAGCTTGAITHYFADKNAVILAALDHAVSTMNARLDRRLRQDPDDILGFLAEGLPLDRRARAEIIVWYSFWSRSFSTPVLARRQRAMHKRWRAKVVLCLRRLEQRGEIGPCDDVEAEAEAVCAIINGIGLRASLDPGEWPAERQVEQLRRHLARLRR